MPTPRPAAPDDPWRSAARKTAFVAGCFCAVVLGVLLLNHYQAQPLDPLTSKELALRKEALTHRPSDEDLKQSIRALDLSLRQSYARHLAIQAQGAWLLFAGLSVLVVAVTVASRKRKLPKPIKDSVEGLVREAHQSQLAVILVATIALGAAVLWVNRTPPSPLLAFETSPAPTDRAPSPGASPSELTLQPNPLGAAASAPSTSPDPNSMPTPGEIGRNWPRFRGPGGLGIVAPASTNHALQWNGAGGQGILWKTPVPLSLPNSPVVWEDRIFLTGANAKKREVYCFDVSTGKLLWQQPVDVPVAGTVEPPSVMEEAGGFAAATAATDGRRVYAIFANGDLAAFDFKGGKVWARNLGRPENHYGHASSLELHEGKLLVQFDQSDGKDNKSKILAFHAVSGEPAWESSPRPVPNSWSSPITIHDGQRHQIITTGSPWVLSHDASTGAELWRAKLLTGEVTPSPIFSGGLVLAVMEGEKLSAIRPDGNGDVTQTHVAWQAEDGLPDIVSPLSDGERVYLVNTYGLVTCYALADGKKRWENDFSVGFHASPTLVGQRVLLISDDGVAIVVAASDTFQELGRSELGEPVTSSPAFVGGRAFIRAKQHLFCLGQKLP